MIEIQRFINTKTIRVQTIVTRFSCIPAIGPANASEPPLQQTPDIKPFGYKHTQNPNPKILRYYIFLLYTYI